MKLKSCCSSCFFYTIGFLSVVFTLFYLNFGTILEAAVRSQLVLEENNALWSKWINVPVGLVTYKYYFFEIVNPDEVLRGGKMKVRERGPYCFKHRRYKRILGWGHNRETVKYMEYKQNFFDPECSHPNTLDDTFPIINPLMIALGTQIGDLLSNQLPFYSAAAPLVYTMLNGMLDVHKMELFLNRSVREVIMGFKVDLLQTVETFIRPLKAFGINVDAIPPLPPNNMFGLLYGRNNTPEGPHEIFTGKGSTSTKFGYYRSFEGKTSLPWWGDDPYCSRLVGSDGTLFPPFSTPTTKLTAFAKDICRSMDVGYQGLGEYKGIPGYKLGFDPCVLGTEDKCPQNHCFCIHKKKKQARCSIEGTYDLGGCQGGAPLILTKPHFLHTYPDQTELVDGLNPNVELHDTWLILEPVS